MTNNPNFDDDFEDWEDDADLFYKEDCPELLKLRKTRYESNPSDPYNQYRFAEALILNKYYIQAIGFLTPIYNDDPEFIDIIHLILDALFAQGKTEIGFKWIDIPEVLRLDNKTKDLCTEILKNKRKPLPLFELHARLMLTDAYLTFNELELAKFLKTDNNFDIQGEEPFLDCKLKKSKQKSQSPQSPKK